MRFETQEDIDREQRGLSLLMTSASVEWFESEKLGPNDIDYLINTNVGRFAVEFKGVNKVKSVSDDHIPIVSVAKLLKLQEYVNLGKSDNAVIVWCYEDGIKYCSIKALRGYVRWGGRPPREGAVNDQELIFVSFKDSLQIKKFN